MPTLLVTLNLSQADRAIVADALDGAAETVYLGDLETAERAAALRGATALLSAQTGTELRPGEAAMIAGAKLVQFVTAGIDHVPLSALPPGVPAAGNGGAYAEPMAEHALALTLAAAKRLLVEHALLAQGTFNQFKRNRTLRGKVCGIYGFGGIGAATARLMRAMGMQIHAINRSGAAEDPVDWIGTPDRLDELLTVSDVLVVCAPLTSATLGLLGARELRLMKDDAILVNLARGEIIDEAALFAHLQAHPAFFACIDAWWVEPVRHGTFRMDFPFLTLPNVIGSPHNSGSVPGNVEMGLRRAVANIRRALAGEPVRYMVGADERMG